MTYNALLRKIKLSQSDFDAIRACVREAEGKTTGEISIAMVAESAGYAFWELLYSVITAFLLTLCLLPLAPYINSWLNSLFWGNELVFLPLFYIAAEACVITLLYLLYNIPFFDRIIIPLAVRRSSVSARAMRHFAESGVYCTENHNGILVFVSYFEREVRIIADRGISKHISQDLWNLIADEMAESLSRNNVMDGFIRAVERCGSLLSDNFPIEAGAENPNELSNSLVILENDRWA